jgi:hypothetical protein
MAIMKGHVLISLPPQVTISCLFPLEARLVRGPSCRLLAGNKAGKPERLAQLQMRSRSMVVIEIRTQNPTEQVFAEDDHVIE